MKDSLKDFLKMNDRRENQEEEEEEEEERASLKATRERERERETINLLRMKEIRRKKETRRINHDIYSLLK